MGPVSKQLLCNLKRFCSDFHGLRFIDCDRLLSRTANCNSRIRSAAISSFSRLTCKMNKTDVILEREQGFSERNKVCLTERSAVLRYVSGNDRFQLKVNHGRRTFNFDRSINDSIQTIVGRIISNVSKKVKNFDGSVDILLNINETPTPILNKEESAKILLEKLLLNQYTLSIQIAENLYDVVVNPPEIFSMKFLKQPMVGFPIFPYKIDASENFDRSASTFTWEFANPIELPVGNSAKKPNKKATQTERPSVWTAVSQGPNPFIFTPGENLAGMRLRLTCSPSDGNVNGLNFTEILPENISPGLAYPPLYSLRLSELAKNESNSNHQHSLRVVTYNCLAESYATEEWFVFSPKESLPPDFRLPFLCKEFSSYQADVYFLQEIEVKNFERIFQPYFEAVMGYTGHMSSKTGNVNEGVALFHNPKKLERIQTETVVLADYMKTIPLWKILVERNFSNVIERVQDRNTVLQICVLKPRFKNNTIYIFANTHLYFHPDADHIRLLQTISCAKFLEEKSEDLKSKYPNHEVSVMFCGDFNCTPPYSSYRFLTTGEIADNDYDWTSHPTEKLLPGLTANHGLEFDNVDPSHELTHITSTFEGSIDFIFYQKKYFELVKRHVPPSKEKIAKFMNLNETRLVSLPNLQAPSDHIPVIADFKML